MHRDDISINCNVSLDVIKVQCRGRVGTKVHAVVDVNEKSARGTRLDGTSFVFIERYRGFMHDCLLLHLCRPHFFIKKSLRIYHLSYFDAKT